MDSTLIGSGQIVQADGHLGVIRAKGLRLQFDDLRIIRFCANAYSTDAASLLWLPCWPSSTQALGRM